MNNVIDKRVPFEVFFLNKTEVLENMPSTDGTDVG